MRTLGVGVDARVAIVAAIACLSGVLPAAGAPVAEAMLPDLLPLRPHDISLGSTDRYFPSEPVDAIRIGTRVANRGAATLDLIAIPDGPSTATTMQCVAWAAGACAERASIGRFPFHAQHSAHWHVPDFIVFELRGLTPARAPDMSASALVASSARSYVCPEDTSSFEEEPPPSLYTQCSTFAQGIGHEWAYEIDALADEQFIELSLVPDGEYAVVCTVNAGRRVLESDHTNNSAFRLIKISGEGTAVEVIS